MKKRINLLTLTETMAKLGVSRATVYRRVDSGHLKKVRDDISNRVYFNKAEVERLRRKSLFI